MITSDHKEAGFTPMGDRVLLKIKKVEEKTAGGIILPDELRDRTQMSELNATIIANGELAFQEYLVSPKLGDKVKIAKFAGYVYENAEGEEYRIVRAEEIVAFDRVVDVEQEIEDHFKNKELEDD